MDDAAVGLTVAAVIVIGLIRKKKAEASALPDKATSTAEIPTSVPLISTSPITGVSAKAIEQIKATQEIAIEETQATQVVTPDIQASQVVVPTAKPVVADYSVPFVGIIDRSVINEASALGLSLSSFSNFLSVGSDIYGTMVVNPIKEELARVERKVRKELHRFERKYLRAIDPIKLVITVVGLVIPIVKIVMLAVDAAMAYKGVVAAKKLAKQVQGAQEYTNAVNAEVTEIVEAPSRLAVNKTGGTLGYLAKNCINSSFIPLVEIRNDDLNDRFFVTSEMLPPLVAANYVPVQIVGYISKIPFSGSVTMHLMYSFELLDFVVATDGSQYMNELVNNGYVEVSKLGYVSKTPIEGPETLNSIQGA